MRRLSMYRFDDLVAPPFDNLLTIYISKSSVSIIMIVIILFAAKSLNSVIIVLQQLLCYVQVL